MTDKKPPRKSMRDLRPATRLVHGGTMRSQFGEMSEALFLTQGFAYESMEQAAARFTGESPHWTSSESNLSRFFPKICAHL